MIRDGSESGDGEPRPRRNAGPVSACAARAAIRAGRWTGPTASLAPGFVQANLVVLPSSNAVDFERFCRTNPRALPLLDVTEPGLPIPRWAAPSADLRTDLPRYRVYRRGVLDSEVTHLLDEWRDDFVAFLTGCSFTFDSVLQAAGIPVRHVELGSNVPMYVTKHMTRPAGPFCGPLVVSMRPIRRDDLERVTELTRNLRLMHSEPIQIGSPKGLGVEGLEYPAHGAPIHAGNPQALGIQDLSRPDYGDPVPVYPGEIPVFWACGVTAQAALLHGRLPLAMTHAPGHMFITDRATDDLLAAPAGG